MYGCLRSKLQQGIYSSVTVHLKNTDTQFRQMSIAADGPFCVENCTKFDYFLSFIDYVTSNGRTICELGRVLKKEALMYYNAMHKHYSGGLKKRTRSFRSTKHQ
jgi:hypothetical protein